METRKSRFEIEKLEERIAPSCAGFLGGGNAAVELVEVTDANGVVTGHELALPNGNTQAVPNDAVDGLCDAVAGDGNAS